MKSTVNTSGGCSIFQRGRQPIIQFFENWMKMKKGGWIVRLHPKFVYVDPLLNTSFTEILTEFATFWKQNVLFLVLRKFLY